MKCWHCETELIWGSDIDLDDSDIYEMVTFLNCPSCNSAVEVYDFIVFHFVFHPVLSNHLQQLFLEAIDEVHQTQERTQQKLRSIFIHIYLMTFP